MMRLMRAAAFVLVLLAGAQEAHAQLQFAGDAPQVYTIQPRQHRYLHEITLGVGLLPINAYFMGVAVSASYAYHFNDLWSWEVLNGFYSFNFNTGLERTLAASGAATDPAGTQRVLAMLSTNAVFKPLFGKLAVFNSSVVQAETFLTLGVGTIQFSQVGQLTAFSAAPNVGLGLEFWATQHFAGRLDVRDYIAFTGPGVVNTLLIGLSASFNFLEPSAPEAPPPE